MLTAPRPPWTSCVRCGRRLLLPVPPAGRTVPPPVCPDCLRLRRPRGRAYADVLRSKTVLK
jgi:hypothetical protein